MHQSLLVFLLAAVISGVMPESAGAIDPGVAEGTFEFHGSEVRLRHAYAHLHDNAEGLLVSRRELRILLVDHEVPQGLLSGIAIERGIMREAGLRHLSGMLLRVNPEKNVTISVVIFSPHATRTLSDARKPRGTSLVIGNNRAGGRVECAVDKDPLSPDLPSACGQIRFSAPLFHEPKVTRDLRNAAARTSPQARVLGKKAAALEQGDVNGVLELSAPEAREMFNALLASPGDRAQTVMKQEAAEIRAALKKTRRVVERGDRAVVIWGDKSWLTFIRESDGWKVD